MYQISFLFLLFFIYSILGYLCEVFNCSLIEKRLVLNRGFCLGPYCPIYGVGSVLMILLLSKYQEDPLVVFILAAVICSFVEYITSYILEKIFKARWWDYSNKRFHIEGRICLENSFLFGLGGFAILYMVNPVISHFLKLLSNSALEWVAFICFIVFLTDVIITVFTMCRLKIAQNKFKKKDATDEITKLVRLEIVKNKNLVMRLLRAFPNVSEENKKSTLYKVKVYLEKREEKRKKKRK